MLVFLFFFHIPSYVVFSLTASRMLLCLSLLLAIDAGRSTYFTVIAWCLSVTIIHYFMKVFGMNLRDCVMVIYADNVIINLLWSLIWLLPNMMGILARYTSFLEALSVTWEFETVILRNSFCWSYIQQLMMWIK